MTKFLEDVHLQRNIADCVQEFWVPGPRYSCKPNERLEPFPIKVIRLIEAEITRCIQPQYLKYYLKDGWQDSKCLSTVFVTATMLFLLPNVKTLFCSGGNCHRGWPIELSQIWGAETMYKMIKRLQSHKMPGCEILQNFESASLRWTIKSQETFEFLEWLAALPNIKSIQVDGISTHFTHTPDKILTPRSSNLTKFEFHGQIHGIETLEGLLQAAESLKCFVYHNSSEFEENRRVPPNVGSREICSLLSKYTANSLEKFRMGDLASSVESLSIFQRLTHLCVQLHTLPILVLPGEISTAFALPSSLENLILIKGYYVGWNNGPLKEFMRAVVNAKDARWPYLKHLTVKYDHLHGQECVESATKDLAEVGVEFHCVHHSLDGDTYWQNWESLF
ncbi:hypothetical protein IMSHALPRED_002115 [Imshaugia aleurites]|uniref:Uncharacterized protein n=1 Tax=Imshaugia aleurites TaxID=172621 RepID=A0A8H3PHW3_9LECA|nr:hypothetical protein IMSHALPRED_002115 [Imshaugia aleurites]